MPFNQSRVINSTNIQPLSQKQTQNNAITNNEDNKFASILKSAINHVNKIEHEANKKTELMAMNKIEDLHDVMITAQKASITIEAAVQIQQKAIDAYNELMRMQV